MGRAGRGRPQNIRRAAACSRPSAAGASCAQLSALEVLFQELGGGRQELRVVRALAACVGEVLPDLRGEHLAELHAPLVEGVDVPDPALHCGAVLVEREELAQVVGVADRQQQRQGWAVPGERLVGDEIRGDALSLQLLGRLAQSEGVGLGEKVRHQLVVVGDGLAWKLHWVLGCREADELGRDDAALVHELAEGVLAVGPGLSEVDRAGAHRHLRAGHGHALAVAFHVELLDVGDEPRQRLAVGEHRAALVLEHADVPHRQEPHDHRQVLLGRRREEVLVHVPASLVELHDGVEAVLQGEGQDADRGPAGEAAANPVPEAEDVRGVDAEGRGLVQRRGASGDVLGDAVGAAQLLDEPLLDGPRVQHGLRRGERLRDDEDERCLGVEPVERALHVDGVHVGEEAHAPALRRLGGLGVRPQGLVDELHAEVGAADADGDDICELLAGEAGPLAGADLLRESLHVVEHLPDLGDDVLAIDADLRVARGAQGDVEHRPALRLVDLDAVVHLLALPLDVGRLRKREELVHRLRVDALAAVVKRQPAALQEHRVVPGLVLEQRAEVRALQPLGLGEHIGPGGRQRHRRY
mmetsp:Transcript_123357/g.345342  ORF Transcript_123357/g.345342 Transcript_123357/m.345342 type:complete len:584 (+) Transcript_123357:170-1921(+)